MNTFLYVKDLESLMKYHKFKNFTLLIKVSKIFSGPKLKKTIIFFESFNSILNHVLRLLEKGTFFSRSIFLMLTLFIYIYFHLNTDI